MDGAGFELPRGCRAELPVGVGVPRLMAVGRNHPRRAELEAFIAERYRTAYGARACAASCRSCSPCSGLMANWRRPLDYAAAMSARCLSSSIWTSRWKRCWRPASTAAWTASASARSVICAAPATASAAGCSRCSPAGCMSRASSGRCSRQPPRCVRCSKRMQVRPLPLAPATGERLGPAMADWGSYYDTDPWVVGGPLQLGQRLMEPAR
jgi:hypothetical protein